MRLPTKVVIMPMVNNLYSVVLTPLPEWSATTSCHALLGVTGDSHPESVQLSNRKYKISQECPEVCNKRFKFNDTARNKGSLRATYSG